MYIFFCPSPLPSLLFSTRARMQALDCAVPAYVRALCLLSGGGGPYAVGKTIRRGVRGSSIPVTKTLTSPQEGRSSHLGGDVVGYYLFIIADYTIKNDMFYMFISWYTAASHGGLALTRPVWSAWLLRSEVWQARAEVERLSKWACERPLRLNVRLLAAIDCVSPLAVHTDRHTSRGDKGFSRGAQNFD